MGGKYWLRVAPEMSSSAESVRQADRENCVPQGTLTEILQGGQHLA